MKAAAEVIVVENLASIADEWELTSGHRLT
jgi:hypothetical protein